MLSAGGPGTGTCWTVMHKSPHRTGTECAMEDGTAFRLNATLGAGPRSTCALRKGNDGDMCEQSLAAHPSHPFCCQYGGARARQHRAVQHTLRRLIEQAGGYADMERHVPELYDRVRNNSEATPVMRCTLRCGLLVLGRLAAALDRRQRAIARMQNVATKVRRNQEWLQFLVKLRKRSAMVRRAIAGL